MELAASPTTSAPVGGSDRGRLPTGTVTFLITDIEGSTGLLLDLGEMYAHVLQRHNELLRDAVAGGGGTVVSTSGDSVFAAFPTAPGAVGSALAAQQALAGEPWPGGRRIRVRMGLHTGEGTLGGDDYVGLDVHRTARIGAAAHGGQVIVSAATAALLPDGPAIRDLGEHRLKDLVRPEHLYQVDPPGEHATFPPLRSSGGVLMILPVPATSFVPRPEVDAVAELVDSRRLVTLTGPGGTGKTRLAIEVGRRVKSMFPDGVAFVGLAPLFHPDLVPTEIITALGLDAGSAPPIDRLRRHLADRSMLLVLDNFEQVIDAAAAVGELLAAAPGVHVLATSRSPLRLAGEQEYPLPPLALPDAGLPDLPTVEASPAVQLFVQRAVRVRPSFALTEENVAAVAAIARRLDGLPLAIELAAARVRVLPPAAIADRLDTTGTSDLVARDRDVPDRQRTLDAVIKWSYDLLPGPAQASFRRFAVFAGGAALDEVEPVVCPDQDDDALALLETLTEQSLLREEEVDGEARFRMMLTIAEFASARLAESDEAGAARQRHADAFLALAERAEPFLTGWEQRRWLDRLEREHDNLRAAFDRCVDVRDADRALRFSAALWRFWQIQGHLDEAAGRVSAALALPTGDSALRAKALEAAGGIAWWRGDMGEAERVYQEALDILEPLGDVAATANARYNLGLALGSTGHQAEGKAQLERAYREAMQAHDVRVEAWAVWGLSNISIALGEWDAAARSAEQALEMFTALNDPFGIGWSLFMAASGQARLGPGGQDLARRRIQEGARLFAAFRDLSALTLLCGGLARVEANTGRPDRALRLVGASRALRQRTGAGLLDFNEEMLAVFDGESTAALAAMGLNGDEAERLIAEGARFSPDEAVAYILQTVPEPGARHP